MIGADGCLVGSGERADEPSLDVEAACPEKPGDNAQHTGVVKREDRHRDDVLLLPRSFDVKRIRAFG